MHFAEEKNFDLAGREFGALFAAANATAFQHPLWLSEFYDRLPKQRNAEPLVMTLRDGDALVGLVPLIRRRKAGVRMIESTDLGVSDYAAPVLNAAAMTALQNDDDLRAGFMAALGGYDLIRIRPVRDDHVDAWQRLLGVAPTDLGFSAHAVDLAPPMEEWRAVNIDRKLAGQMARKRKRWHKQAKVEFKCLKERAAVDLAIRDLARLRKGRFEGDRIGQNSVRDFYAAVAARGAEENFSETWIVTADGAVAGIVFGLTHAGRFLYLLIGCDYDAFGRHSPGLQMYDQIIENWIDRQGTVFDFTIGDEPFKKQFGTHAVPMFEFLAPRGLKGRLAVWAMKRKIAQQAGSQ